MDSAVAASLAATFNTLNQLLPEDERNEPLPVARGDEKGKKKNGKRNKDEKKRRKKDK